MLTRIGIILGRMSGARQDVSTKVGREDRERVNRIVEALLCVPADRRAAALDAMCPVGGDSAIRAEVERLIADDGDLSAKLANFGKTQSAAHPLESDSHIHPAFIGRYRIGAKLGGGGMGQVFLAEQPPPISQPVAIKLIKSGFDTADVIVRFDAERQTLARMDHPSIARILDAGATDTGRPFFVMEFVPGKPITEFADENRLTVRQRLELFADVCDAIGHAHTKGIIHRDLKPSNILASMHEGLPRVKVIDFGIAKALISDGVDRGITFYTQAGTILGTYEYMSPEQAEGSIDLDTRTDVYSLGVLLYEMLCGLKPFERAANDGQTDEELRRAIREIEPPSPSARLITTEIAAARQTSADALTRLLERELEWIPLKATRKERERRYANITDLRADIDNYLRGRALIAAPESKLYVFRKTVMRHRAPIAAGVIVLLLLAVAVIGTTFGLLREARARRAADWAAYRAAVTTADVALQNADGARLRWAIAAAPEALRGWEWNAFAFAARQVDVPLNSNPQDKFVESTPCADNRHAWSSSGPGGVSVYWNLNNGQVIRREEGYVAVSPVDSICAIARLDGSLDVLNSETRQRMRHLDAPGNGKTWAIASWSFSLDGSLLLAWDGSPDAITIIDLPNGEPRRVPVGTQPTELLGFVDCNDGVSTGRPLYNSRPASGTFVVDLLSGVTTRAPMEGPIVNRRIINESALVTALRGSGAESSAWLPHRSWIAQGLIGGSVRLMNFSPQSAPMPANVLASYIVGVAPVRTIIATPDESRLVVTMRDGSVHALPLETSRPMSVPAWGASAMEPSPDASRAVLLGWGDVQCFEPLAGTPIWGRNIGPYSNEHAAWSTNGQMLAIASEVITSSDGRSSSELFVLNGATGEQIAAWSSSPVTPDPKRPMQTPAWIGAVDGLAFSADDKSLLISRKDGSIQRVDSTTWEPIGQPSAPKPPSSAGTNMGIRRQGMLRRSPDGSRLAQLVVSERAGASHSWLLIRDADSLAPIRSIELTGFGPTSVAWSPDSRSLAVGFSQTGAAALVVVDAASGQHRFRIDSPDGSAIMSVCYSRDARRIVAATRTRRIFLDASSGEQVLSATLLDCLPFMFFTADDAMISVDPRQWLMRTDTRDPESSYAALLSIWPDGTAPPKSVSQARGLVSGAIDLLHAADDRGAPLRDVIAQRGGGGDVEDASKALSQLTIALSARRPSNINMMNSSGLTRLWNQEATIQMIEEAAALFRAAVALKPHSANLQDNLGSALFRLGKYDECRAPLSTAIRIRAQRGLDRSVSSRLRLAIASHRMGDADAEKMYQSELAEVMKQDLANDTEIRPLLEQAKSEFGY